MTRRDNPWRAYLTIIEGCDKACSYCVVPYTRGPERSRASDAILRQVRQLADLGYSEVQLLGQTVNSYADPTPRGMRFSELLMAVGDVQDSARAVYASHPSDFEKDIVKRSNRSRRFATTCICRCNPARRVLRAMQRTYSREEYLEIALSEARPIAITTDVIVGFRETESISEQRACWMKCNTTICLRSNIRRGRTRRRSR